MSAASPVRRREICAVAELFARKSWLGLTGINRVIRSPAYDPAQHHYSELYCGGPDAHSFETPLGHSAGGRLAPAGGRLRRHDGNAWRPAIAVAVVVASQYFAFGCTDPGGP